MEIFQKIHHSKAIGTREAGSSSSVGYHLFMNRNNTSFFSMFWESTYPNSCYRKFAVV